MLIPEVLNSLLLCYCRSVLDQKLEAVMAQRQKFSFQPYITSPPSAINIIMSNMCSMGHHQPLPDLALGSV